MKKINYKSKILLLSISISTFLTGCGQIQSEGLSPAIPEVNQQANLNEVQTHGTMHTIIVQNHSGEKGNLKLLWKAMEKTFSTLATQEDIDTMKIELSGPSIESINEGQPLQRDLEFGSGGLDIQNIPEGPVHIKTTALDAEGNPIGSAQANDVQINSGETATVNLVLNLKDELVIEEVTNTGNLELGVSIVNGQVVTETKVVTPQEGYAQFKHDGPPPPPKDGKCPPPPPIPKEVMDKIAAEAPELLAELEDTKGLPFEEHHAKMTELAAQYPDYIKAPPAMSEDGSCPPPPPPGGPGAPPPPRR